MKYYIKSWKKGTPVHKETERQWIGHILHKNCLLKHFVEEKMEGTR